MGKYYHITPVENVASISFLGILANSDGEIFVFEDYAIRLLDGRIEYVADLIARNQLLLERYAMFEINPKGIRKELVNDNVAEITAKFQWILRQPKISKSYIKLCGIYEVGENPVTLPVEILQR